MKMRGVTAT